MYQLYPGFATPPSNTIVRRYMSIEKFESLLETSSLFFSNILQFNDKDEGIYTEDDKKTMKTITGWDFGNNDHEAFGGYFVNSWTKDCSINNRFWKEYASIDKGIAIESTIGRIIKALDKNDNRNVYISDIHYMNYRTPGASTFDKSGGIITVVSKSFSKNESFRWEDEIRLLFIDNDKSSKSIAGVLFKVDLKILISNFLIAPQADSYCKLRINELLSKYGFKKNENNF